MKLKSLYEYYCAYFNIKKGSNRYFGRAVGEMAKITKEVLKTKSTMPIHDYLLGKYCNSVTKEMIKKLFWISISNYADPIKELYYFHTLINIDRSLINTKHRGIQIPLECGIDYSSNEIIIPVYGSKSNLAAESGVLKGLIKEFELSDKIPIDISTITYWNLYKGTVESIDFSNVKPVAREILIKAANKIE